MDNLVINIPLSRNKHRGCISCIHCPELVDENGNEVDHNSDDLGKFIKTVYGDPLTSKEYPTLNDKIILWSKSKGCNCPATSLSVFCKNAILTYSLRYFKAGVLPYKKESFLFGKNILRLMAKVVYDDGTLNDMYGHTDSCPGHELKDCYKREE